MSSWGPLPWRRRARAAIGKVITERVDLHHEWRTLRKLIEKAYPFGERQWKPYEIWREEVMRAHDEIAQKYPDTYNAPSDRKCLSCGANPDRPCKRISDDDPIVVDKAERKAILHIAYDADEEVRLGRPSRKPVADELLLQVFHAARLASVKRLLLDAGPLFGGPT